MKFLADMGISPQTVAFLRKLGHDAIHLSEQRLHRLSDQAILQKAVQENRILLTHDLDFADLVATTQHKLPSIIIFRLKSMAPINVNHHIKYILDTANDALQKGIIASVNERQIRIRELPI